MVATTEVPVLTQQPHNNRRGISAEVPPLLGIKNLKEKDNTEIDCGMLHDSRELIQFAEQMMLVWEQPTVILYRTDFHNLEPAATASTDASAASN